MAVTKNDTVIIMTAATDQLAFPVQVKSIRWVAKAAVAGDDIQLVESSIGTITDVLWTSVAAGANYVESDSNGGHGFDFRNGVRVGTIDVGTLYLYL